MSPFPLLRIPQELLAQTLALLPLDDQISAIQVCSLFHDLILYTPSLQRTRYALDSGMIEGAGPMNRIERDNPDIPKPQTHTIMGPLTFRLLGRLFCASTGGTITRYAYWRCYDGEPLAGVISRDIVSEEQLTQKESEENDTAIIAHRNLISKYKITDVTDCPFLDEPFLRPSSGAAASVEREESTNTDESETDYLTFECQVFVRGNIFQSGMRDPLDWVEKFKVTKHTTVRQITAALMKAAFRKLELTGLQPQDIAENGMIIRRKGDRNEWIFTLVHHRTSPEIQNMVWKLESSRLGDYTVYRRIIAQEGQEI